MAMECGLGELGLAQLQMDARHDAINLTRRLMARHRGANEMVEPAAITASLDQTV